MVSNHILSDKERDLIEKYLELGTKTSLDMANANTIHQIRWRLNKGITRLEDDLKLIRRMRAFDERKRKRKEGARQDG
jgi:hypothetical protein